MKKIINKVLLEIHLEEEKRKSEIEEIRASLNNEDKLYMENIELFYL